MSRIRLMEADRIKFAARRGAVWSLFITAAFFPLPYLRNWFFSAINGSGALMGRFQLLILLVQAVHTFVFPGGRNVMPAFLPKLDDQDQRSRFVFGYLYITLAAACAGIVLISLWPECIGLILQASPQGQGLDATLVDSQTLRLFRAMIPLLTVSGLATSVLMAFMAFATASALARTQLLLMTALVGAFYFTGSLRLLTSPNVWILGTVALAAVMNLVVSVVMIAPRLRFAPRPLYPAGCFRFSVMAYLDTVMVWAYMAIDSLFITTWFGEARLGIYLYLLYIAQLIPRAVQELGHLILTTFSKLLGSRAEDELASSYRRVTRLTVGFYALLSIGIIYFAKPLAAIFGPNCAEEHAFLVFLAVAANVESLRTVNSMTLMAYEKMGAVFVGKLLQIIVQFSLTVVTIPTMGIFGVILAKGVGLAAGECVQIFAAARLHRRALLTPPAAYIWCQGIVLAAGFVAYSLDGPAIWLCAALTLGTWTAVGLTGRYRWSELRFLVPRRAGNDGGVR